MIVDVNSFFFGLILGFSLAGFIGVFSIKLMETKYHKREKLIREGKL